MKLSRRFWSYATVAVLALALSSASSGAGAGMAAPHAFGPSSGTHVQTLPSFSWSAVGGADHYEFALAADPGFNSPVQGNVGHFTTRNTRATVTAAVPNGTYWWHVRAIGKNGNVGDWSPARSVVKSWSTAPKLMSPGRQQKVSYPAPLVLTWRAVAGAAKYDVALATDPALGSLVTNAPVETSGTSLAPAVPLHVGTYYWAVTPVDVEGNKGVQSEVRSFQWTWPSVPTNLAVHDLVGPSDVSDPTFGSPFDTALYLPQFSWNPVPGATRYELEINSDQTWASGSRVCCDDKILRNVFTPLVTYKSNRYYWRVRAFDAQGNAGAWSPSGDGSAADSFIKTFDNVCGGDLSADCIPAAPSIRNMRVEDWSGAGVTGQVTSSPVVVWDPVPGASSYEYEVTPFHGVCDFTWPGTDHWRGLTAAAAWTPLAPTMTIYKPYPDPRPVSIDFGHGPVPGTHYCVRVRAQTDRDNQGNPVYGDYTLLTDAFTYGGTAAGVTGQPLASGDYLTPTQGQSLRQMPFFRWRPVAGARSYWVLVAKDPSFTNIVDYALTNIPAYAPRGPFTATSYPDETTTYYWAVLPATGADGTGASGDPVAIAHGTFQKQIPPTDLTVALDQPEPVFRWKPVPGARRYEVQVSADPNFGTTVETATTASTSYTAAVTYPPGKKLYWRVRADDENLIGLSWATSSFNYKLPAPVPAGNATSGIGIPTWHWRPVPGAVSYSVHVDGPNGARIDFMNLGTAAVTPVSINGTGVFHWEVRANFPNSVGTANGPFSRPIAFARKIAAPRGPHASGGAGRLLLAWAPTAGAARYQLQVSKTADFSQTVEQAMTDVPMYAPLFAFGYDTGGRFYWRVAALDANGNSGDYSRTSSFSLPPHH